jgi:DNA-binding beta-propeller fold protein YncE
VLPGPLLIADRGNDRLVEVDPHGRMVWSFPRPGDLRGGQTFRVPDDAFFSADGRRIVATEEDDSVISVIDVQRHRIVFRYGMPGQPGAGPNQVHNPDDALFTAAGSILTADIKNCRLLAIRPPQHVPAHVLGRAGACGHDPPRAFSSPNGAFPMRGGNTVVTEIGGDWIDVLDRAGRLVRAAHPPGFSYPSDSNEVRPGVFLSVDYVTGGAVETFDGRGRLRWRFAPSHPALNKPSLALPLPNGDVVLNDDFNHRVIVVNPHSNRIVWQYGHTAQPGHRPGYLQIPDGVDLAPPYSVSRRFPHWKGP